jgi:L-alanine-DL-glutamate epimerase-like enolase superfamily enzyme
VLKVKIGGSTIDQDVDRLVSIAEAAPDAQIVLDGNTAFTPKEATLLIDSLGSLRSRVTLFEQPVERDDFEGLKEVEQNTGIPVAADESLRSEADFQRLLRVGGISAVNIKTAKLGLLQAWDLLVAARRAGLAVMVGGMVETELSMTASACLAAGVGGVAFVDLDTPLLLGPRPLAGGFVQKGPHLDLSQIQKGHGVTPL